MIMEVKLRWNERGLTFTYHVPSSRCSELHHVAAYLFYQFSLVITKISVLVQLAVTRYLSLLYTKEPSAASHR